MAEEEGGKEDHKEVNLDKLFKDNKTLIQIISIFAVALIIGFLIGKSLCIEGEVLIEDPVVESTTNEIMELPSFNILREGNAGEINEADCYDEIKIKFGYEESQLICGMDFVSAKKCSGVVAAGCIEYARCLCYYTGDIDRTMYRIEY